MKISFSNASRVMPGLFLVAATLSGCATSGTDGLSIRNGPQAVHPGTSALAQRGTGASAVRQTGALQAWGRSEARAIFDTYCTQGLSNNDRVQVMLASGRFANGVVGKLPVNRFRNEVFVFFKLLNGDAQIGFASRRGAENYCVAVDGTATGNELYVTDL